MRLGRVVGRLWSTVKLPQYDGKRFLIVQPIDAKRKDAGDQIVCMDTIGAGAGETIYFVGRREASVAFLPEQDPAHATIVGVVDEISC